MTSTWQRDSFKPFKGVTSNFQELVCDLRRVCVCLAPCGSAPSACLSAPFRDESAPTAALASNGTSSGGCVQSRVAFEGLGCSSAIVMGLRRVSRGAG